ncbi:SusC/RagA family TonB-linked outer membrane protein [Parabacteroides pacaensis]|uniref:SusC/RagA family TonB-linked outer membrane protein n=1 Tax=Parabacteroides pacaensis TaxID=2086575 RepID=UPI00131BA7ED|nr:SusC/RagA family TonB-linked outer membrane protein [Parabacteroides pacaensis]
MRFTVLFFFMSLWSALAATYSQTVKLTLDVENKTILQVLKEIEKQSKLTFVYNVEDVKLDKKVSFKLKDKPVADIFKILFDDNGLSYIISDYHITLYKKGKQPQQRPTERKIAGTVTDGNGEPIPGANIVVKNSSSIGTISDINGQFELSVPEGAEIEVSFIGYKNQHIKVTPNKHTYIIELREDLQSLDEIVVTAMGLKREKKALGYAMQEIKADAFSENRAESLSNLLQGKVAGVQIRQSASDVGGSTRVILRGTTSLSGNGPLWVVDGIPISDGKVHSASWSGGRESAGGASEINPENIESISVLKGANAAALYGSRAQNGAVIVTTKQGRSGKLQLEYNGNITATTIYSPYKLQHIYGQGAAGEYSAAATGAWGNKMDGTMIRNWREQIYGDTRYTDYPYSPQGDYIKDFYDTGLNYTNTLTASGGTENMNARFSFSDSRSKGITPGHTLNRQYYDLNTTLKNKYIDLNISANYIRQIGRNRPRMGSAGTMQALILMPNNIRLQDLENPVGADDCFVNWAGKASGFENPYAIIYNENHQVDETNRLIGRIQLVGKITDYLKITGRVGMDWRHTQLKESTIYAKTIQDTGYSLSQNTGKEFNADLTVNFDKKFGDFNVISNLGGACYKPTSQSISGNATTLVIPGLGILGNGNKVVANEGYSTKRVNSAFGNVLVGYKSWVYLEVTGRNDWSSTLPHDHWSYFYPSVSLSGILSDIFSLPEPITYLKIRGSWAKVGNDTGPYRTYNTYSVNQSPEYGISASAPSLYPFFDLKPEETTSIEGGLELSMFHNRLGLDVTYYDARTINQILTVNTASSSGYRTKNINAGKMTSHGLEIMLRGTPIETKDWTWDVIVNWGMNRSKCVELTEGIDYYQLTSTRSAYVRCIPGHRYGEIVGEAYKRDGSGRLLVGDNGMPIRESEKIIGNMNPDWTGAFNTSLRWKNLSFGMLVDVQCGGNFVSYTDMYARGAGTSAKTLANREKGMVVDGIVESTGAQNTKVVSVQDYYNVIGGMSGVAEEFLHDASYVKLRELTIGYTLPQKWLRNLPIRYVKISAVGRNLFYIYKNAPINPEGSYSNADGAQAIEYGALPPTRNLGFSLNVKF